MTVAQAFAALGLGFWVFALACGASPGRVREPDGSYRLECNHELAHCLKQMESVCKDHGYDVMSAKEERVRAGPMDFSNESIRSQAHVKCRTSRALFTPGDAEPKPAPPAAVDSAPLPAHAPLPPLSASPPAAPPPAAPPPASASPSPASPPPEPP